MIRIKACIDIYIYGCGVLKARQIDSQDFKNCERSICLTRNVFKTLHTQVYILHTFQNTSLESEPSFLYSYDLNSKTL